MPVKIGVFSALFSALIFFISIIINLINDLKVSASESPFLQMILMQHVETRSLIYF